MLSSKRIFILILFSISLSKAYTQVWPINQTDDPNFWNRISGTFGEVHPTNGNHFHGAIDIDNNTPDCPANAIEAGQVTNTGSISINVDHEFPAAGQYNRRSRYLHINPANNTVAVGTNVNQGNQLSTIENNAGGNGNHLHLEMWERINGVWYRLNPLNNNNGWVLPNPVDNTDPQINDIFISPLTQINGVSSGFFIPNPLGGITTFNINFAKIHIQNRPQGPTETIYNSNNDQLLVFGNIGFIANTRDRNINSIAAAGHGLTLQRINYSIENVMKYDIEFDRINNGNINNINQIFHTAFNNNDVLYGNNDFIELYSSDNIYLHPHKQINGVQSNGIWFTKARNNTQQVFNTTPTLTARFNSEALYSDGETAIRFHVEDASGRDDDDEIKVIIDNFKPYIKKVQVRRDNNSGTLVYNGQWDWNGTALALNQNTSGSIGSANGVYIKVFTSEPMRNVSLSINSLFGYSLNNTTPIANSNNQEWEFIIPATTAFGVHTLNFNGVDYANNPIEQNPSALINNCLSINILSA